MIADDQELETTLERIRHFQAQVAHLRNVETNPGGLRRNFHNLSGVRKKRRREAVAARSLYLSDSPFLRPSLPEP